MPSKKQDRQTVLLSYILILTALILMVNMVVRPGLEEVDRMRLTLDAAESDLNTLMRRIDRLPDEMQLAEQQYTAELKNIDAIKKHFSQQDGTLIDTLSAMADRSRVELSNLRRIDAAPDGNVIVENSQLTVRGDFADLVDFIQGIETMPRLANLSGLRLSGSDPSTLNARLTIWSLVKEDIQ